MKELKFRIWDNNYNEFIRPDYGLIGFCYPLDGRIAVLTSNSDIIEDCVIEQYTDLKDKNGKEIYEGDILKVIGYGAYEVFWRKWDTSLSLKAVDTDIEEYKVLMLCEDWEGDYEVIGNIHENADLLEEK